MAVRISTRSGSTTRAGNTMGRGCGTLFFGVFLAFGLVFTWLIVKSTVRTATAHGWPEHRCTIESSEASDTESESSPYGLAVRYRYEIGGETFTSSQLATTGESHADYAPVQRALDRYAAGTVVPCWVNPENHADAVLEQRSRAIGAFIIVPLIFVLVGAGGIVGVWVGSSPSKRGGANRIQDTVGGSSRAGTVVATIFFGIFLAGGLGAGYFVADSARNALEAPRWTPTPCTVESSHVREHESTSDGHTSYTYSVDILYRYQVSGHTYRANRWRFPGGSSSGRAAKEAIVDEYPPGRELTCYVNPRDPVLAVIQPQLGASALLFALPLVFALVGASGLYGVVRSRARERREARATAAERFADPARGRDVSSGAGGGASSRITSEALATESYLPKIPGGGGAVTLAPQSTPLGRVFGVLLVGLFWNGIVSVFLWQLILSFQRGSPEWFLAIFLIPFVLIGLALIGGFFWSVLALANPRATVRMRSACVPLGGELEVAWELSGRTHVIERLTIHLEGVEEVTYRRGTNTHTERNTFRKIEIVNTDDRRELEQGRERVRIPAGTIHSFEAPNNKITWNLVLDGEIRRWPNVSEKYPVVVVPAELGGSRSAS